MPAPTNYSDVAALRLVTPVHNDLAETNNFAAPGDGGGGLWVGVTGQPPGTFVHNAGTVIVPSAGNGSAAWTRVYNGPTYARWFGAPGASASFNHAALTELLKVRGECHIDAGSYPVDDTLVILPQTRLTGAGKTDTIIVAEHGGDAIRSSQSINGSHAVEIYIEKLGVRPGAGHISGNVAGGFVDVCGTYWFLRDCLATQFKYGAILDQSELSEVTDCRFEQNSKAGVWLVNGADHTSGADPFFTNRIRVTGCQFNEGQYGIIDDGGYSHTFPANNYNGQTIACVRVAGALPVAVSDSEMEAIPIGVLCEATTEQNGTGVGSSALSINDCVIVASDYSVRIMALGSLVANNNLLYGEYAFNGLASCYQASGQGNVILNGSTIYQDTSPSSYGSWHIPETGVLTAGRFQLSPVTDVASPLLWVIGSDRGAILDTSGSPTVIRTFPNRGSYGGSITTSAPSTSPEVSTALGKRYPLFSSGKKIISSLPASRWTFLHDGSGAYTILAKFRTSDLSAINILLGTFDGGSGDRGINLHVTTSGALSLWVGNASGTLALQITSSSGLISVNTDHVVRIACNKRNFELFLNGARVAGGTSVAPSSTAGNQLSFGSNSGSLPLMGELQQALVFDEVLDHRAIQVIESYLGVTTSAASSESTAWGPYTNAASAPSTGVPPGAVALFSTGNSGSECLGFWTGSAWRKAHAPGTAVD